MPVHNADIAAVFDEIADLLDLEGENPFRIRAYRNAARTLRDLTHEVSVMVDQGEDLTALPGIGKDLAAKIREVLATGTTAMLEEHRKRMPPALTALLKVPGLGPKRVKTLYRDLGLTTLEALEQAARTGRLRALPGFGAKTEARILQALAARADTAFRFKLAIATQYAEALAGYLKAVPGVAEVAIAGSYRRAKDTIGDLDILVVAAPDSPVMDRFVSYGEVREVLAHGSTKSSVVLACGL